MSNALKTYLITGGAGFIGANFVKYLVSKNSDVDFRVVVLDALTYAGNLQNLEEELEHPNVTFVKGDIADTETVKAVFERYKPDYVVNFAAESHVDRSLNDARKFLTTNVIGTQTLLQAAVEAWSENGAIDTNRYRFLQVSTDEVYGTLTREYETPEKIILEAENGSPIGLKSEIYSYGSTFFTEDTPLSPRSPYSASKAAADMLVMAYGETFGMPVVITRCSNNYGPYQFPEKLIPLIINNLRLGNELPVYGDGKNVRDWLYVEDHVGAIYTVLNKGKTGEVYNIGGFNEQDNISLVRKIISIYAQLTGTEPRFDLIRFIKDRPGHDMRYAIDPGKAVSELGWSPTVSFEDGLRRTVAWYVDNTDWMNSVTSGEYINYYERMYADR